MRRGAHAAAPWLQFEEKKAFRVAKQVQQLDRVIIRFAGDSGDGMQLTGDRFTQESAAFGNDLATFPNFPAEIRAPQGTLPGVSSFQVHFADHDILTAGDAPDVARVTIRPVEGGVAVDVALAGPTRLGPYGWIVLGVDTDRDPYTGGGRGDELLLLVNGEGATFTRWTGRGFSPDFAHHDVQAALSGTDLTLVLSWADIGARSFNFSVATLREDADLAPGFGIAAYPRSVLDGCPEVRVTLDAEPLDQPDRVDGRLGELVAWRTMDGDDVRVGHNPIALISAISCPKRSFE